MKHRIATVLAATLLASACSGAASPSGPAALSPLGALPGAEAAVTKSLSGEDGGGNISGAGDRLGDLLSGWGSPVLIAFAGLLLIGALSSRNVGTAVGIVLVTLVGLIFLLSPQSIEAMAKAIANVVF
jgi:hypothetical protein